MVMREDRVQALVGILGKEVEDVTALAEKRQERIADLKRENNDGTGYFCWYSMGDTCANTPTSCMHKLANAGWSHVERSGEDDTCEWQLEHSGPIYNKFRCSKCEYEYVESRTDGGATDFEPRRCPECGRWVR